FLPESAVKSKKSVKKASEISDAKLYKRTKKVQPVKVQVISNERPTKTSGDNVAKRKKSVAEIAPNKVVNGSKHKTDSHTEKIGSSKKLLEPLAVDTSPNSLSETKENVASINTSTVAKTKSSHSKSASKA